jgi:pimeloyl-ACP methyl ester carboxylesterase
VSAIYRFPRKGTALERQMLAATPRVFVEGYRLALEKAIPDRRGSLVFFWGMSTGGASLYPLAKYYTPDGYLGWGTSSTGLAYVNGRTLDGNFNDIYEHSAWGSRTRPRRFRVLHQEHRSGTRMQWWKAAQKDHAQEHGGCGDALAPRSEHGLPWTRFPPTRDRKGLNCGVMQAMFEPSYPPVELKNVPVLDLNGTDDEVLPPSTVDANRKVMEPYAKRYRVGRIAGLHHYLFTQDSIKIVGSTWMRYIESGYFD